MDVGDARVVCAVVAILRNIFLGEVGEEVPVSAVGDTGSDESTGTTVADSSDNFDGVKHSLISGCTREEVIDVFAGEPVLGVVDIKGDVLVAISKFRVSGAE